MPEWLFTTLFFVVAISFFVIGFFTLNRFVWEPKRQREREARPRITADELAAYWRGLDEASLPMARAMPSRDVPAGAVQSRIGGAPFAASPDVVWPVSKYGTKMILLCQINFSEFPQLEEFPKSGLIQIFSSLEASDETYTLFEVEVRYIDMPEGDVTLKIPDEVLVSKDVRRAFSRRVTEVGLPIKFEAHRALGNPYNYPFYDQSPSIFDRLPENDDVAVELNELEDREGSIVQDYGTHWVGGQPNFVQNDIRQHSKYAHLDRVLFHLGCDDDINIGDAGEVNILINARDLREKNFEKAVLTWDCG